MLIRRQRWRVRRVGRSRAVVRLDVVSRRRDATFLSPFDRAEVVAVRDVPRRVRRQHLLARLAGLIGRTAGYRDPVSALGAHVDLLAYQLEPAMALQAGARRILLADEVGLGKTIQAGLAIAETVRRDAGARVLVLAPAPLIEQWRSELTDRLGIRAEPASQEHLAALERRGGFGSNPWRSRRVWIASVDYLKQPHVLSSLPESPFDLLVIDEAHEAAGDSERAAACHELGRRSRRVMLLTATPDSGDADRLARLLRLGSLPCDDGPPMVLRRTRRSLGIAGTRRIRWCRFRPTRAETEMLDALLAFERRVRSGARRREPDTLLLLSVFRKRALSTATALRRTLDRRIEWLARRDSEDGPTWIQPSMPFDGDTSDELSASDCLGLAADVGLPRSVELSWLRRLRALSARAGQTDSRVARLVRLLSAAREPAVVFTEFRDSLDVVARALADRRSIAILQGALSMPERRTALDRFLSGSADTLLATDVAGVGLNLQSRARWVINLELPWNPVRLEQRAGRVDRLGQTHPVRVSLMACRHPAENHLVERLAARVLAARGRLGDDVLQSSLPDEHTVRRVLLTRADQHDDQADQHADRRPGEQALSLTSERRWQRRAHIAARRLAWRRALIARAPSQGTHGHRPAWSEARSMAMRQRFGSGPCLVFSVPLLDGLGGQLESRLVVIRVDRSWPRRAPVPQGVVTQAGQHAALRMQGRARRLARLIAKQAQAERTRDTAILDHLRRAPRGRGLQPGLFDSRQLREARAASSAQAGLMEDHARRIGDARLRQQVIIGEPILEVVFES